MGALCRKTVLLVTHQVDFLPAFDAVLVSFKKKLISLLVISPPPPIAITDAKKDRKIG